MKSSSVEWVDPRLIEFKISPHSDLKAIQDGDWDIDRRTPLAEATKHRAIVERYRDGRPWGETELFKNLYQRRISRGSPVRGCWTMKELLDQYEGRVDAMFAKMKREGFIYQNGRRNPLPKLLIGRGGEIFIGNQGNHRLAMAQVIGLEKIAGEVICRHSDWSR